MHLKGLHCLDDGKRTGRRQAELPAFIETMVSPFAINAMADFPVTAGNGAGWQLIMIDVTDVLSMTD